MMTSSENARDFAQLSFPGYDLSMQRADTEKELAVVSKPSLQCEQGAALARAAGSEADPETTS
jgi:hypothetical protein